MRAIVFDRFGEPAEVLGVRDGLPLPEPGPNQVRVRMLLSPVNPSDLMTVRGVYGSKPSLPATPGYEGLGVVEAVGPGLLNRLVFGRRVAGKRVAVLNGRGGNWAEAVIIPSRQAVPLSAGVRDDQGACFFANPATAFLLTRSVLRVPQGAWLLQTAAAGALGRMVIRLGRHFGFRTINVVRRREQAEDLRRLGADAVVCTADESLPERVRELTGGDGVKYAIDCVGGATAADAVLSLGAGGRLVVYGTLSGEPMPLNPRALMVGQKRVEGFWLTEWAKAQRPLRMLRLFRAIGRLIEAGVLTTEVGATFPMADVAQAVRQAEEPGKRGKVLVSFRA